MFLRQSLRYRRLQTLVLVGVSTLIAGCAAFGPLFARAVEQSITTNNLSTQRDRAAFQLSADPQTTSTNPETGLIEEGSGETLRPEDIAVYKPDGYDAKFEKPQPTMTVTSSWGATRNQVFTITAALRWTDDFCAHITMVRGRCPDKPFEVALSVADRDNYRVDAGDPLYATSTDRKPKTELRITGVYRTNVDDPYWYDASPVGKSLPGDAGGAGDALFTPRGTFEAVKWGHTSQARFAPLPGVMRLDDIAPVANWIDASGAELDRAQVHLDTQFPDIRTLIDDGRKQATRIIPLVMIQVAIFGLVVLALAAGAVIDQRRPELAIARLRGRGPSRAGREVFAEMALLVLVGTVLGGVLAFGVTTLVRHTWLAGGAPAELTWQTPAAVGLALLAGLGSILLALRPVVRLPVATLLRTVPVRRRGRAFATFDVVLITLAIAGLAATLTGDGRGPLAIVTPTLLAVAAGLALAGVVIALSGPVGTAALRRGRLAFGLAALQVARLRIAGRLVPVVAVATTLVAFAGQASAIANRNRELRSGLETGADTVLTVSDNYIRRVKATLDTVDKDRNWSTLVSNSESPSAKGLAMIGIEPDSFRRIAIGGAELTDEETYQRFEAPEVAPVSFRGSRVTVTTGPLTGSVTKDSTSVETDGNKTRGVLLGLTYVNSLRVRASTTLGLVPLDGRGPTTLTGEVNCHGGCQLLQLRITRDVGDTATLDGKLTITGLRGDADTATAKLSGSAWDEVDAENKADGTISAKPSGTGLGLDFISLGAELVTQNAWVPTIVSVIPTPDAGLSGTQLGTAPGLDGVPLKVRAAGPTLGPVPRNLYGTTVADLTTLTRWGGPEPAVRTTAEIWLNHAGAQHLGEITAAFAKAGMTVRVAQRLSDSDAGYARSASALALRLTPVVGAAAWSLALVVLLLLAVSTRRSRVYDNAGLQLAGVRSGVTSRSARLEQVGLVAIATIAGTVCGIVGGQLALPLIPLFETDQPAIPIDLGVSWPTAVLSLVLSAAVLCAGALAVAFALRRRTRYGVIREELS